MSSPMSGKTESALREEICRVGASLYQRGYTVGTAGTCQRTAR